MLTRSPEELLLGRRRSSEPLGRVEAPPTTGAERSPRAELERSPLIELSRDDFIWSGATGLAAAALFATVLTNHPYLGDGPESVAGVSSLGILHDPGYFAYVLTAHLFALVVAFGTEAFRVNLFSLVCGALTIAGVQLLARRIGAPRWAGAVAALTLAASASFWYYSGFAKHDIFSGLLLVISLHLLLAWRAQPTTGKLVALVAVIAFALWSSWPLEVLMLPSLAFVLFVARRSLSLRSLIPATATGLVVIAAMGGFVMLRASDNPPVNWGGATTISKLWSLVNRADFTPHGSSAPASVGRSSTASGSASGSAQAPISSHRGTTATVVVPGAIGSEVSNDAVTFSRELGVLGLLLAAFGLVASLSWRRNRATFPLLLLFLVNLIAARQEAGFGSTAGGFDNDLIDGGVVLGCYFVLACWLAIGAAELAALPGRALVAGRLEGWRPLAAAARARLFVPAVAVVLGVALVAPLVLGNWSTVHRSSKPFVDHYAQSAFSELPPRAAVFMFGAELTQPLIYRQVVYHERPDVVVIAADGLEYSAYHAQLSRRLGIPLPEPTGNSYLDAARVIKAVSRYRPVYLGPHTAQLLSSYIGYRPVGLLTQLAPGHGQADVADPGVVEQRLLVAERRAGFPDHNWDIWPNNYVAEAEYSAAALKVAQAYYQHRDYTGMRNALRNELTIQPGNPVAEKDLAQLGSTGAGG